MTFVPKIWLNYPNRGTPISAAALIDIETRLGAYTDSESVKSGSSSNPLNTSTIIQGSGTYDVRTSGIPNVASVGNLDYAFATGDIISNNTSSRNRFQTVAYIQNDQNQPSVAGFRMGKGSHAWGGNDVGYTFASGHVAIGNEVDYGNVGNVTSTVSGDQILPITTLNVASTAGAASTGIVASGGRFWRYTGLTGTSFTGLTFESGTNSGTLANGTATFASVGGTATGLVIVAEGGNVGGSPAGPYLQMQSNTASQTTDGIRFINSGQPAVMKTGRLISASGEDANNGIDFSGSKFATTAGYFPLNSGSVSASFGLILDAQGGFANGGEFIDIRASAAGSNAQHGILFRLVSGNQPLASSGSMITTSASFAAAIGLNLTNATLSTAGIAMGDNSISFGTTTGTKFGTSSTQKQAWWGNTPVIRDTGWGTPTGTFTKTAFDTASVTLPQLAQAVAAIINTMKNTYGLLGA